MTRSYFFLEAIISLSIFVPACTKDEYKSTSGRELLGIWVNVDHLVDSLIIFKGNNDLVLFDNSMAFRTNQDISISKQAFTSYIRVKNNGIEVTGFKDGFTISNYKPYTFIWIQKGVKFKIAANSFRPYLNCAECLLTYERVK